MPMIRHLDLIFIIILLGVLYMPIIRFLSSGWTTRRREIIVKFDDDAITSYFKQFYPGETFDEQNLHTSFETHYNKRFGRRYFVLPFLTLFSVSLFLVFLVSQVVFSWLVVNSDPVIRLPAMAVSATAGAYMWVVFDLISRARRLDLAGVHLLWASFRFVIATPVAYAFAAVLVEPIGVALAFLLGAFPTHTLFRMARRLANRHLGFGDSIESTRNELEELQCVNTSIAERFSDEGITTILQLAYCDPVDLTVRSGFSFNYVVDCVSQALAWLYFEDHLEIARRLTLRGAQEIKNLIDDFDGQGAPGASKVQLAARKKAAGEVLELLATKLDMTAVEFERILREISEDPYTEFISDIWQ